VENLLFHLLLNILLLAAAGAAVKAGVGVEVLAGF
jgi:hypothetical protein